MEHCAAHYTLFISNAHALKVAYWEYPPNTHTHHQAQINHVLSTHSDTVGIEMTPNTRGRYCPKSDIAPSQFPNTACTWRYAASSLWDYNEMQLETMKARECVCKAGTHARDLWTAANKPGSCSVVLSNLPRGSSGLYFCSAYLWESERVRKENKITSSLVGEIKAFLSSILIRVLLLSHRLLCLLQGCIYTFTSTELTLLWSWETEENPKHLLFFRKKKNPKAARRQ